MIFGLGFGEFSLFLFLACSYLLNLSSLSLHLVASILFILPSEISSSPSVVVNLDVLLPFCFH
jgi:hypothetical protein